MGTNCPGLHVADIVVIETEPMQLNEALSAPCQEKKIKKDLRQVKWLINKVPFLLFAGDLR